MFSLMLLGNHLLLSIERGEEGGGGGGGGGGETPFLFSFTTSMAGYGSGMNSYQKYVVYLQNS